MRRAPFLLVILAALVLAVFVDRSFEPVPDASVDACTAPLHWHLGDVDPRFDLSPTEVRRAVAQAARLWEEAGGRQFFTEAGGGMTINLVYDERQESLERRRPHQARAAELGRRAEGFKRRVESLERQVQADRVDHERLGTSSASARYRNSVDRYNRAVEQYNLAASRYNEAVDEARAAGGPAEVRAGDLQWTSQTVNGTVVSVQRTLTVGLVGSYDELVLVLAHELGHAIGLDHVPAQGAVMAERYRQADPDLPAGLHPADRESLARQCAD